MTDYYGQCPRVHSYLLNGFCVSQNVCFHSDQAFGCSRATGINDVVLSKSYALLLSQKSYRPPSLVSYRLSLFCRILIWYHYDIPSLDVCMSKTPKYFFLSSNQFWCLKAICPRKSSAKMLKLSAVCLKTVLIPLTNVCMCVLCECAGRSDDSFRQRYPYIP